MTRPVLHTERLGLEPLTVAHVEQLVELDADPEVMRFLTGRASTRAEVVETWLPRRTDPAHDARSLGYWVAHDDEGFVGWFCLTPRSDIGDDVAELGYRLRRAAWGRGYATEGARALVDHGFASAGLLLVVAETMTVNVGSRTVLRAVGLRHVRTEVRTWDDPLPGAAQGEAVYELSRDEWSARRPDAP